MSLAFAAIAWAGVVGAAGYAMGDSRKGAAIALVIAGAASLLGIAVGFVSWGGSPARHTVATLGLLANAVLLAVGITFALAFHW